MSASRSEIPVKLYYRIGEVAEIVGVEPHVLRYWETEFRSIRPSKSAKGQRVYSRRDVEKLLKVKTCSIPTASPSREPASACVRSVTSPCGRHAPSPRFRCARACSPCAPRSARCWPSWATTARSTSPGFELRPTPFPLRLRCPWRTRRWRFLSAPRLTPRLVTTTPVTPDELRERQELPRHG